MNMTIFVDSENCQRHIPDQEEMVNIHSSQNGRLKPYCLIFVSVRCPVVKISILTNTYTARGLSNCDQRKADLNEASRRDRTCWPHNQGYLGDPIIH
jgi:hypothetical protein